MHRRSSTVSASPPRYCEIGRLVSRPGPGADLDPGHGCCTPALALALNVTPALAFTLSSPPTPTPSRRARASSRTSATVDSSPKLDSSGPDVGSTGAWLTRTAGSELILSPIGQSEVLFSLVETLIAQTCRPCARRSSPNSLSSIASEPHTTRNVVIGGKLEGPAPVCTPRRADRAAVEASGTAVAGAPCS